MWYCFYKAYILFPGIQLVPIELPLPFPSVFASSGNTSWVYFTWKPCRRWKNHQTIELWDWNAVSTRCWAPQDILPCWSPHFTNREQTLCVFPAAVRDLRDHVKSLHFAGKEIHLQRTRAACPGATIRPLPRTLALPTTRHQCKVLNGTEALLDFLWQAILRATEH